MVSMVAYHIQSVLSRVRFQAWEVDFQKCYHTFKFSSGVKVRLLVSVDRFHGSITASAKIIFFYAMCILG